MKPPMTGKAAQQPYAAQFSIVVAGPMQALAEFSRKPQRSIMGERLQFSEPVAGNS